MASNESHTRAPGARVPSGEVGSSAALTYLERLQDESEDGFHRGLRSWVDDQSSAAKVLRAFAESTAQEDPR